MARLGRSSNGAVVFVSRDVDNVNLGQTDSAVLQRSDGAVSKRLQTRYCRQTVDKRCPLPIGKGGSLPPGSESFTWTCRKCYLLAKNCFNGLDRAQCDAAIQRQAWMAEADRELWKRSTIGAEETPSRPAAPHTSISQRGGSKSVPLKPTPV